MSSMTTKGRGYAKVPAPGGWGNFCEAIGNEHEEEFQTSEWYCNLCLKYCSSHKELKRHFKRPHHRAKVKSQRLAQRRDNGGQDADDELDDDEDDNYMSFTSEVALAMKETQISQSLITKSEFTSQPPPPPSNLPSLSPLQSTPPLKRGRGRPRKNKTDQSMLTPEDTRKRERGRGRPPKYKSKSPSTPILPTPTASSAQRGGQGRRRKRPQEDDSKSREDVEGKTKDSLIRGHQESESNEVSNKSDNGSRSSHPPVKLKRGRGRPRKMELQEPSQEKSPNQSQSRELKCVACNLTFASQYNLDRHFKTRLHGQNSTQNQLSPSFDDAKEDDNNADVQIVHEEIEKPPNRSPSMLQVGLCFQWNGKQFQVKEVHHRQGSKRRRQAIQPT